MEQPQLHWDVGTAYDFFISLVTLHDPKSYGLRAAWAAGVRSRLPAEERETLDALNGTVLHGPPFIFIQNLPAPRDGAAALHALEKLSPKDRLRAFMDRSEGKGDPIMEIYDRVIDEGHYSDADVELILKFFKEHWDKTKTAKDVIPALDILADAETYGNRALAALTAYYDVFFAEEERRIAPALQEAVVHAQRLSTQLDVIRMIEELSMGVTVELPELDHLTLAPSYWSTPFIWYHDSGPRAMTIAFGARPADASLVPGEIVPDTLVQALKALSDPTRLRILHYLSQESLTPTQLAGRLRLRPPTVVHHLKNLRVAGLVRVRVTEGKEKSYAARTEMLDQTFAILKQFIAEGGKELVLEEEAALD